jgi:DNA polymerase II small subunit/DNA polymerase delta subunit B
MMDLEELTPQQRRDFAVDCFDRVYKHMSHYDLTGEFRKVVDTVRVAGEVTEIAARQQFARRFVREIVKAGVSRDIVYVAKAGRECVQGNYMVAVSLAAQASANPKESKWQDAHLRDMLRGDSEELI